MTKLNIILCITLLTACTSPAPNQERRKRIDAAFSDVKNVEKGQYLNSLFSYENRLQQDEHHFQILGWGNDSTGQVLVLYKNTLDKSTAVQSFDKNGHILGSSIKDADADSLFELHLELKKDKKHFIICEVDAVKKGLKPCNIEEQDA